MVAANFDLKKLSTGDLERIVLEIQGEIDRHKHQTAFWDFVPAPFQKPWWESKALIRAILAGNQAGKTSFGAVYSLSQLTKCLPRALGGNPDGGFPVDVAIGERYLACGESFDQVNTKTIVPKLREYLADDMLPRGMTAAKALSVGRGTGEITIRFKSGAELVIMAYQQARQVFEGGVFNGAWFDEEPPEDIWNAVRRGLIRRNGWTLLTGTSLDQVYIHDQIILPFEDSEHPRHAFVDVFEAVMHSNCSGSADGSCPGNGGYLPHERIMEFAASITDPEERAARIFGKVKQLEGVNFKYVNPKTHVIPDFEWPIHWPLVEVCDPSQTRGLWLGWYTKDQDDLWYMVQARHIPDGSFNYMASQLKACRRLLRKEPDLAIMDRRGGKAYVNKHEQLKWFEAFADEGIDYVESVESPLETLHDWLEPKFHPRKEANIPKLRFFRSVEQEEKGPLWALGRFKWGETTGVRQSKKFYSQEAKDWIDNMKYLASFPTIETRFASMGTLRMGRPTPLVETYSRRHRRGGSVGGLRSSAYRSFPMR